MKFSSKNSEETLEIGEKLGSQLVPGMVVALEGDLGGGKTTFTKGVAKGLGITEDITSPSFTLEKVYPTSPKATQDKSLMTSDQRPATLYHFDFYRIENPRDMMNYELIEALDDKEGIVVAEWAEKIEKDLPEEKLVIKFNYISDNEREIEFNAYGDEYKQLIQKL